MPDVVLRPRRESCALTLGPAFASVTDERGASRSFPRDGSRGAPGAAARVCARVADGPPGLLLPEIRSVSLVDGRGAVLATLRWDGNDHEALEAGCAAAGIPLDRVPTGVISPGTAPAGDHPDAAAPPEPVRSVRLPAPGAGSAAGRRRGPRMALTLGPRDVVVTGLAEDTLSWPRLGCAPAHRLAVARLRVILYAERPANDPELLPGPPPGRQRVVGLTLLGGDGEPLGYLPWAGGDLDTLRRACAVAGLQPEYRWQPHGEADLVPGNRPPGPQARARATADPADRTRTRDAAPEPRRGPGTDRPEPTGSPVDVPEVTGGVAEVAGEAAGEVRADVPGIVAGGDEVPAGTGGAPAGPDTRPDAGPDAWPGGGSDARGEEPAFPDEPGHRWLYGLAFLVLVALATAAAVLASR